MTKVPSAQHYNILAISDTHDRSFASDCLLKCYGAGITPDVFIHTGDGTNFGNEGEVERLGRQLAEIREAFPCPILYVAGNHDLCFERHPGLGEAILADHVADIRVVTKVEYFEFAGLRILASPFCPPVGNWAFCRSEARMAEAVRNAFKPLLGARADVTVSHAPPYGILDDLYHGTMFTGYHTLTQDVVPHSELTLCGHIHEHGGEIRELNLAFGISTIINCAGVPMLHKLIKET